MIKKFNEYVSEQSELCNEELDASTVGVVGSGTAITGYPTGTYTPAAGVSVYGGDSESSFASNSSGAKGMEQEVICPPHNIFREPTVKKRRKNKKERLNNQIGATIDSLSKPVLKVSEALNTRSSLTIVCQYDNLIDAHRIISKIKDISPDIRVSHNESIVNSSVSPDWLFIRSSHSPNDIYINYWGNDSGYENNLAEVMNSIKDDYCDHHLYHYNELPIIIRNIRAHFNILEVPNYNPRKINHNENMKTFKEFNRLNEDYLSIGNTVKITYPGHDDVDKIGIITDRDGDFLTVDMGTHTIKINASSILDLNEGLDITDMINEDEGGGGVSSATLGNTGGMGAIVSAQPSSIPGDVAGSTKGSGDISGGRYLGPYAKAPVDNRKKKKKKDKLARPYSKIGAGIDNFYVTKYAQGDPTTGGKVIQSWKTFTDTKN